MASPGTAGGGWRRWAHPLRSVRVRITLAAVVVTALAVGTAGGLLVRSVENAQVRQIRDDINADLDQVVVSLRRGEDPDEAVKVLQATPPFGLVEVLDEHGYPVASYPREIRGTLRVTRDGASGESVSGESVGAVGGEPATAGPGGRWFPPDLLPAPGEASLQQGAYLVGSVTTPSGEVVTAPVEAIARTVETPTGDLTVTAAAPVDQMSRSVEALRQSLLIGLPALIAAVAGLVWVLVGRALRPVDAIRAEADEITGSTMYRRVPEPPTSDEIGRLARTMNAMLCRLDAAATRQRQFVSDASHELRSPVAAIRTGLEVAQRKGDRANWPAVVAVALAEESRLEALLDDLLLLASQDENGDAALPATPVDLTALAESEAERPRRVPVRVTGPGGGGEPLVTPGSADELARVVSNLVDNAARYASSEVRLGLEARPGSVRLTVDDDGPGIPAGDRDRVFERFARLDDSRARPQGGTGLGLAVVRSVVTRHHGLVWIEDSPAGGARFVVELHARPAGLQRAPAHVPVPAR